MATNFKDLELTNRQYLLLKQIQVLKRIRIETIDKYDYNFLIKYALCEYDASDRRYFVLSDKARMYMMYHRKNNFRFRAPFVISVVALIGAYRAEILLVARELMQLLKTIVESLGVF